MNISVAKTLMAKSGTGSVRSILELSLGDIQYLNFGVYDELLSVFTDRKSDWIPIMLLDFFIP